MKVYIPSWAQFPDDFHPIFFASQKLTEQMQRWVWESNGQGVGQGKLYKDGDGDIRCCDMDEWKE